MQMDLGRAALTKGAAPLPDFFVDSAASPGGDGLTALTAFNTVAAMVAALGSSAYKRVAFKFGTILDESWNLLSSNIGTWIYAYGNPADGDVLWRCDEAIDPTSISIAPGRTDVRKVTLSVETDLLAAEWPGIWSPTGIPLSFSAVDLSANEGKPGTFWHGTVTDLTTIDLYFRPYLSDSPTVGYRYAKRKGLNAFAAEDVTIDDHSGRRNYTSYGSICLGRGGNARRLKMYEGNTHNIYVRPGKSASGRVALVEDCLAQDSFRLDATPTAFITHEATTNAGSKPKYRRCKAKLTYNYRLPKQAITGITSASPGVVTCAGHGLTNGLIILLDDLTGPWAALNGLRFVVASVTTDTFALQVMNTTGGQVNYSTAALAAYSGNGGIVKLAPYEPNAIAFFAHTGGATSIEQIDYEDCESFGFGNGFAGANTLVTNVLRPKIEQSFIAFGDFTGELHVSAPADMEIVSNVPPITGATAWRSGGANGVYDFVGGIWRINATGNFRPIHTGCTLKLNGVKTIGFNSVVNINVANITFEALDNDYVPDSRQFNPYSVGSGATGLVMNSNRNKFNGASANIIYLGTTYPTFSGYQAASGQDLQSAA